MMQPQLMFGIPEGPGRLRRSKLFEEGPTVETDIVMVGFHVIEK